MNPTKYFSDIKKHSYEFKTNSKEEIKICAKLDSIFGFAAGYMIFDSSMPEFEEIKHAFISASQKYFARIGEEVEVHEREIFNKLKHKFER